MITDQVAQTDDQLDLLALWRIGWRYKYLIAGITLVCGIGALIVALNTTPIFRAEVVVTEVHDNGLAGTASQLASQFGGLASLAGINLGSAAGQTEEAQAVLASRKLIEEFVQRENLLPELSRKAKRPPTLWRAVENFRKGSVAIRQDKRKGVTIVSVDWADPKLAAKWANGIVALANETLRTRARENASRNIEYLEKHIPETNVIEVQRAMYGLVENEMKTLMLANARAEYAFTVVDPAVAPELKVRPKRSVIVLLGLIMGTVLGAAAAFAHNAYRTHRARQSGLTAVAVK